MSVATGQRPARWFGAVIAQTLTVVFAAATPVPLWWHLPPLAWAVEASAVWLSALAIWWPRLLQAVAARYGEVVAGRLLMAAWAVVTVAAGWLLGRALLRGVLLPALPGLVEIAAIVVAAVVGVRWLWRRFGGAR